MTMHDNHLAPAHTRARTPTTHAQTHARRTNAAVVISSHHNVTFVIIPAAVHPRLRLGTDHPAADSLSPRARSTSTGSHSSPSPLASCRASLALPLPLSMHHTAHSSPTSSCHLPPFPGSTFLVLPSCWWAGRWRKAGAYTAAALKRQ